MLLDDEDTEFIHDGDTLYYEKDGKAFDSKLIIDQYKLETLLGEGGFGRVYRAKNKLTNEVVAIKYMDLSE